MVSQNKPKNKSVLITKEEFLNNTREEEVFSLIHEFLERYKETYKVEAPYLRISDRDINVITEQMITDIKSQVWLKEDIK